MILCFALALFVSVTPNAGRFGANRLKAVVCEVRRSRNACCGIRSVAGSGGTS